MKKGIAERLAEKTIPEPNSGCLLYLGSLDGGGYGGLYWKRKLHTVHRIAWELEHGPIPSGQCICHKCDTPSCVNVNHMFIGTKADNIADMDKKGRRTVLRGEANGLSKLTNSQVLGIRKLHSDGYSYGFLTKTFSVSKATIHRVITRKTWRSP